jgi:hypothetical protein
MTQHEAAVALLRRALNNEWVRQVEALDQQRHLLNDLEATWIAIKQDPQDLEVARQKLSDRRLEAKRTYELAWDLIGKILESSTTPSLTGVSKP